MRLVICLNTTSHRCSIKLRPGKFGRQVNTSKALHQSIPEQLLHYLVLQQCLSGWYGPKTSTWMPGLKEQDYQTVVQVLHSHAYSRPFLLLLSASDAVVSLLDILPWTTFRRCWPLRTHKNCCFGNAWTQSFSHHSLAHVKVAQIFTFAHSSLSTHHQLNCCPIYQSPYARHLSVTLILADHSIFNWYITVPDILLRIRVNKGVVMSTKVVSNSIQAHSSFLLVA